MASEAPSTSAALDALLHPRTAASSAAEVDRALTAGYGEALSLVAERRTLARRLLSLRADDDQSRASVVAAELERLGTDLAGLQERLGAVRGRFLIGAKFHENSAWSRRCPRLDGLPGRDLEGGLRLAVALSRRARMDGLARLDALPLRVALHIPRCRSVHTFGMRFALDLIWLGGDGQVVRVDRAVPPRRMRSCVRARSIVEMNAGVADAFLAAGVGDLPQT
jgi:uncharacterized membrane protein (UPF0127 family)